MDADKIFVVNNGNIEASGKHEQLLSECGLYRRMWDAHRMAKDEDNSGKEAV